jgi:hypothetical protein
MNAYSDLAGVVTFRPLERPIRQAGARSPFSASWTSTVALLAREIRMLRPREAIMQIDVRETDLRQDGMPRADRNARTPGVVLSLVKTRHGDDLRYEVGTFDRWQDNVRAIALSLEALRAVDRYGVTKRGEQYRGWRALPVGDDVQRGRDLIREHGGVREAQKATHPDRGGSEADFKAVQAAIGAAQT